MSSSSFSELSSLHWERYYSGKGLCWACPTLSAGTVGLHWYRGLQRVDNNNSCRSIHVPPGTIILVEACDVIGFQCPFSGFFAQLGPTYTGGSSVANHTLSKSRGTPCRWRGWQLGSRGFVRRITTPGSRGFMRRITTPPPLNLSIIELI